MKLRRFFALVLALVLTLGVNALATDTFTDVAADAYFADAVEWAAEKQVTNGRGNGIFDPESTVNRAEAVTFLWRMAGQPAPTQTETFADVESDANNWWYKTAVQWAVEKGITNGTGEGFSPTLTCSRGMILTMLYRMQGCPFDAAMKAVLPESSEEMTLEDFGNAIVQSYVEAVRSEKTYPDVPEGQYYELPVYWAAFASILSSNQIDPAQMLVQPNAPCPRGEMVYFLYRASGDAPAEGAVKTGKIPETLLLDEGGVKITATGIKPEGLNDAIVNCTVVNGSDKTLRVDADDLYVNTYVFYAQVCIPTDTEEDWTFYADAVVAPGETKDCELRLNSLDDRGIAAVYELEFRMLLQEVEKDEEGDYTYVDEFAAGAPVTIQTSIYDKSVSYDLEGTPLIDKDGLKLLLLKAENSESAGPQITLYAYNGGSENLTLDMAELKLDGEPSEGFFGMDRLPAGKRCVTTVSAHIMDYDHIPVVREAELTLQILDPETWEPKTTLDPVKIPFGD